MAFRMPAGPLKPAGTTTPAKPAAAGGAAAGATPAKTPAPAAAAAAAAGAHATPAKTPATAAAAAAGGAHGGSHGAHAHGGAGGGAGAAPAAADMSILKVAACGAGGITELAGKLDPEVVTFALARVPLGSGTFARDKLVLLHVNSERCPPLKRGRINGRKGAVRAAIGEVHAEQVYDDVAAVTMDGVLEECRRTMVADDTGTFSIAKMKADYEAMVAQSVVAAAAEGAAGGVALTRKTAAELGSVKADAALKAVKEPMGAWNWCLFNPDYSFVNAGSLSVPEMVKWLAPDQFYFGILRLGFGSGRFRRTKWIFLAWSGAGVGMVKRARAAGERGAMKGRLGPVSVDIEATVAEDVTLTAIIDKVRRAAVVDGDDVHAAEDPFSVDKFMEALAEEAAASASFFGDKGLQLTGGAGAKSAATLLAELRTAGAATNWVSFTVNV